MMAEPQIASPIRITGPDADCLYWFVMVDVETGERGAINLGSDALARMARRLIERTNTN